MNFNFTRNLKEEKSGLNIRRCTFLTLACALSFPFAPLNAGPDEITSNLMNRGISLFDFGMYRLGSYVHALAMASDEGYTITSADYSIDNNVITIRGLRLVEPGADMESVCAGWIRSIREAGHIDAETGGLSEGGKHLGMSGFASLFTYPSTARLVDGKTDLEVAKELDKKIFLEMRVTERFTPPEPFKELVCTAPLLGNSFAQEYRDWAN